MSKFGDDLIHVLGEALAHAKGKAKAVIHRPVDLVKVRLAGRLTQAQMAP